MTNINKLQQDYNNVSGELYIVKQELKLAIYVIGVFSCLFFIGGLYAIVRYSPDYPLPDD